MTPWYKAFGFRAGKCANLLICIITSILCVPHENCASKTPLHPMVITAAPYSEALKISARSARGNSGNTEALTIRIGFWGPLYLTDNKDPPKKLIVLEFI